MGFTETRQPFPPSLTVVQLIKLDGQSARAKARDAAHDLAKTLYQCYLGAKTHASPHFQWIVAFTMDLSEAMEVCVKDAPSGA